jgi:hypothetical protein
VVTSHERIRIAAAALVLLLLAACAALSVAARNARPIDDGLVLLLAASFGATGFVVARSQPRNPIGWILTGVALTALFDNALKLYLILDYREHGGRLPLGTAAVHVEGAWTLLPVLVGLLAILLFPDGTLSRRWRRVMWAYVALVVWFMLLQIAGQVVRGISGQVHVDAFGNTTSDDGGLVAAVGWFAAPVFLLFWGAFVWRQVASWRSATGVRRAQLKWLMAGSATCVVSCVALVMTGDTPGTVARVLNDLAAIGITTLPIAIGVAILRYRLYEIDRLISRTLSYAVLTGLLVGVFAGIVLLTTRILPFSSPVAVAVSTLAAAALFNPLRRRVQRLVDHRFNRARYDRDALVARFGARLRDAVDSDAVVAELAGVAAGSVEPAHISVWVRS